MNIVAFVVSVVVITASGALSPGPLTISAMLLGSKNGWKAGLLMAIGHMVFELPYIILLAIAYDYVEIYIVKNQVMKSILAIAVFLILIYFAITTILESLKSKIKYSGQTRLLYREWNPIIVGFIFTALNPYFLLWWATLGFELIRRSLAIGIVHGVTVLFIAHIWMDYVWLILISHAPQVSINYFGSKAYRGLLLVLAIILILFALNIVTRTFLNISLIPI